MKSRYRLIRRSSRGGAFYCVDNITGKRTSLDTTDEEAAKEIIAAKNNAAKQPALNLQLAKAYLAGIDSGISTRTWRAALFSLTETKHGANKERWERVAKDSALSILLDKVIVQTQAELLLKVLSTGTVSTNVFLRRLHNCLEGAQRHLRACAPRKGTGTIRITVGAGRQRPTAAVRCAAGS